MSNKKPIEDLVEGVDAPEEPIQAPVEVKTPAGVLIVSNGDSWRSLAEAHAPKGVKVADYAVALCDANLCVPLREGTRIVLPGGGE